MPNYQLVVYGASSFVGEILTRYLFERHGANGPLSWAIAGRSPTKLAALRSSLGPAAAALPIVLADAANLADLAQLCASAQVIASTVGPYALYGSELVKLCAETGTDYCDLTGEVQWIQQMITAHSATAKATGARIVHCCGFDSIPSDLGVHFLQSAAQARFGSPAQQVKLRIKAMRGAMSGGTVASLMNVLAETASNPALRKVLTNPFALAQADGAGPAGPRQPNVGLPEYCPDSKSWLAPFVMASINTRIVHRSNALSGHAYGADFVYDEAMMTGPGIKGRAIASAVAGGLAGFMLAASKSFTRSLLANYVVPKPGEGPSPEAQRKGFYDFRFFGRTAKGETLVVKVTGDRDPGYGSTGKMLGEAAVCLVQDCPKASLPGGFYTPATAFAAPLTERLTAYAGLTFNVL